MLEADVVVVGAGLTGLAAARALQQHGHEVVVLDEADAVGGRIRTDRRDGLLLDRGFQLLNPAYPALEGTVDVAALGLQQFRAGVVVRSQGRRHVLADPRRAPTDLLGTLRTLMPRSTRDLQTALRVAGYLGRDAVEPSEALRDRDDVPYGQAFDEAGLGDSIARQTLESFLAGVLADDSGRTSRRFVDLLLRTFARGLPGLPRGGMQALPEQVADRLTTGTVRLTTRVTAIDENAAGSLLRTDGEDVEARVVVVATGAPEAHGLTGIDVVGTHALTTYYHWAPESPAPEQPMLHLDADREGPVVNTAVVSDSAPSYARTGALVQVTVLGSRDDDASMREARSHAARLYGADPISWEPVATYAVPHALPAMLPPLDMRRDQQVRRGLFVAGDHRDTASIQGALVSGARVADAVHATLAPAA